MSYLPYNTNLVFTGNITPSAWYQQFTNNRGTPDLALISILSEIVYWYRPKKSKDPNTGAFTYVNKFLGDAWQTSYEHFERKLGFNREKIRKIFVKLEQMGICLREFRNVKLRGQTYNNRLFIHLSSDFLNSCTTNKEKNYTLENSTPDGNPSFFTPEEEGGSPHLEGDHIIDIKNKNIIKDRSMKSNFLENNLIFKKEAHEFELSKTSGFFKPKELKDFYPLSPEDCQSLQSSSRREFSLKAMNEILSDMSKRLSNRYFNSKRAFMSYMSKVFANEMRDAVKTSNENFRIKSNKTGEEITLAEQEKYLTEIEYNVQVSTEWHLKKKLASVFETGKSYELLKSYHSISQEGSVFTLHLDKYVELTSLDKEIILKQVKATHEYIDINRDKISMIESLRIKMPEKSFFEERKGRAPDKREKIVSETMPDTIWGRVRKSLIAIYGEGVDLHWFSKLEAEVNEESRVVQLKTSSSFIRDWIQTNYFENIEKFARREEYRVNFI